MATNSSTPKRATSWATSTTQTTGGFCGATFVEDLRHNPQLAMRALMTTAHHNATGNLDFVDARDPGSSAQERDSRLRLPGRITVNKTSTPTRRDLHDAPTKTELAWLIGAERLVHDILAVGLPDSLAAQAELFATLVEPVKLVQAARGLDRRGAALLEAAARHCVHRTQPVNLRFVPAGHLRVWHADQTENAEQLRPVPAAGAAPTSAPASRHSDAGATQRLFTRPRLLWAHPAGICSGLLIDRFHHTHRKGLLVEDSWTRRKVSQDLRSVHALLEIAGAGGSSSNDGERTVCTEPAPVLGVRVLAHRAPNEGVHFLPAFVDGRIGVGAHHRIGECAACAPRTCLPNSGAAVRNAAKSTTHPTTNPAGPSAGTTQTEAQS